MNKVKTFIVASMFIVLLSSFTIGITNLSKMITQ